jgi:DNA-binding MarR family transcriptional regulator
MPKSLSKTESSSRVGGVAELKKTIKQLITSKSCDIHQPLPTMRELAEQHYIFNASVCRLLKRLDDEGVIWRRQNGRYYPNESRRIFERRKPYACLIRKLQHWSHMYHAIMSGFSQAFGSNKGAMLFVHNETLVRHADTAHPPVHAALAAQREALMEFFRDHEDQFAGILFDDVWLDEALGRFSGQLGNSVVVCRTTNVSKLSSVSADFDSSAMMAIGHLYSRGYEEIWIAVPFENSAPVDLMRAAALKAAASLGSPVDSKNVYLVATPADRERFVARIKSVKKRIGLFCLEDNISLILWRTLVKAGIDIPRQVGLLSGMGDIVADQGMSTIKIDYEAIGRAAGEILMANEHRTVKHATQLLLGKTT